ncbi:heavy metal transporter [Pseudoscardovia radai]|uniref:heavy metal transporter n=1 Tax=Pseudoscardovia radai TaxID=987066 RepID=UPI0039911E5D
MADETTQTDGTAVTAGAEPHGDAQEPERPQVDWKAKYEQAVAESRKWEERSKANRRQADQLKGEAVAAKTDADRLKELEAKVAEYETAEQRDAWVKAAAAKYAIPTDILSLVSADSEEAMMDAAKTIGRHIHTGTHGQGSTPRHEAAGQKSREWVDELFAQL